MYGTFFRMKVKAGHEDQLLDSLGSHKPQRMIGWFMMKPDNPEEDFIGCAIFEDKEAHLDNANSPEQNEVFNNVMKHLQSEPSWIDGEYIAGEVL